MKRKHHDLVVWQAAMDLVTEIYRLTAGFPKSESYGLTSQLRRAAVSIPSNIAEGAARTGTREFLHFLSISRGSLSELETQVLIAKNIRYINNTDRIMGQIDKVFGLIGGLINSLRKKEI